MVSPEGAMVTQTIPTGSAGLASVDNLHDIKQELVLAATAPAAGLDKA